MLTGKTALITGSTQGLGLASAERFATAGCNVVLSGLGDGDRIERLRAQIKERSGVRVLYHGADLRHPAQIEQLVQVACDDFGAVDILVNNAVVRHAAPVESFAPADWEEAIAVNLSSAFHTIRLALPGMREKKWGRIINVSSIYGLRGATNRVAYVTTKTALIGLTRAVALETAGQGITCNAICPGTTRTPVHEDAIRSLMKNERLSEADAERRVLTGKQPTGRLIAAEHVVELMLFLCGASGADVTGSVFPFDGGWSAS